MGVPAWAVLTALLLVPACATAPTEPAAKLAESGMETTSKFGGDVRSLSTRLRRGDVSDAFVRTWELCSVNPPLCRIRQPAGTVREKRNALADTMVKRAAALDALHAAYKAMKVEADYDARTDMEDAIGKAIDTVNSYSASLLAVGAGAPGAALISQPLTKGATFAAGRWADFRQRQRLLAASRAIGPITLRLRDAMTVESWVFDSIVTAVTDEEGKARAALLQAGLVSASESIKPMAKALNVEIAGDAETTIAKSPAAKTAAAAAIEASAHADALALHAAYRASIGALDGLVDAHADLESGRDIDLESIDRFLAELDALTDSKKDR